MDPTCSCIGCKQLKHVDKRRPLQEIPAFCCKTDHDEGAKKRELAPTSKDIVEKTVYVPPSILRLKSLSISESTHDAESSEHSKSESDIPNEEVDKKSNTGHQHCPNMSEDTPGEHRTCAQYVRNHSPDFCELEDLRLKGWNNPEGDEYFTKQRYHVDNADLKTTQNFLRMMNNVATKMQEATGVFSLSTHRPTILGLGFAPGGFIAKALEVNPNAHALGITLPAKNKGIPVLVKNQRLDVRYADITLMAEDMGLPADAIPPDHPDAIANNFVPKLIRPRAQFDLVTSEGGVLRPHQERLGSHRSHWEAERLITAQLALALSRVKLGGSMIVLLHKAEAWNKLCLFYTFEKFSRIRLFKPDKEHQHRSSFYMIATDIQSNSKEALAAVEEWKRAWKIATFGTNEQCESEARNTVLDVDTVLEEFGEKWIELGAEVWNMQLEGLKQKHFAQ